MSSHRRCEKGDVLEDELGDRHLPDGDAQIIVEILERIQVELERPPAVRRHGLSRYRCCLNKMLCRRTSVGCAVSVGCMSHRYRSTNSLSTSWQNRLNWMILKRHLTFVMKVNRSNIMEKTDTPFGEDFPEISHNLVQLAEEENRLISNLVEMAAKRNKLADRRTEAAEKRTHLSEERTDLVRKQTQFSSHSSDLAEHRTTLSEKRTELAEKRTGWANKRTDLANSRTELSTKRTDLANDRTELAGKRTGLSETRTDLAGERTQMASNRTSLSSYRSLLARGRTELAFIRTGLAFVALGIGLIRYFGFGPWTLLDGTLVVLGALSSIYGTKRFITTIKYERRFSKRLHRFLTMELEELQTDQTGP